MMFRRSSRRGRKPSNAEAEREEEDLSHVPVQFRRMLSYLFPYWLRLIVALFALTISAVLGLVFPAVIGNVVDSVLSVGDMQLLTNITLALIGIFLFRTLTSFLETYNLNYIGERIVLDLRKQLFNHLIDMPLGFFTERRVGELVSRVSSDVTVMRTVLTNNVNVLLQQTLMMVGSIVIMIALNARLTLFIVVMVPVIVVIGFVVGFYQRRISTEVQDEIAGATVVAEEVFQGVREVKTFVREPYERNRYSGAVDKAFAAAVRLLRIRAIFGPMMGFFAFGGLSMILWYGGVEVIEGRLSGGELITFLIYGLTVAGSFASLVGLYTQVQEALGATRRVFQILDTPSAIQDKDNAKTLDHIQGRITFENVQFSYDGKQDVLNDIVLDIAPGEIVALVGPSGAGKSTMFNMIPRFYDVTEGVLKVDNHDVRDVTKASLRSQIGIVPQETLLFGGTIRENILYGRLDATEAELIEAAKAANAHEFIEELPDGYNTIVGERGVRLSGGQRQRVAIARAILKDPRILLLDEATSSLDNESEHLVQEALGRLMRNRTTVIIAHRLSTVRVAHRIAVIDHGEVVELGRHDELMAQAGLYARLYDMQFRDEDMLPMPESGD